VGFLFSQTHEYLQNDRMLVIPCTLDLVSMNGDRVVEYASQLSFQNWIVNTGQNESGAVPCISYICAYLRPVKSATVIFGRSV
jgi:hypothetical protein